jgi:hypothetical protein
MPEAYAVAAVTSELANVAFDALGAFTPEYWHFTREHGTASRWPGSSLGNGSWGERSPIWVVVVVYVYVIPRARRCAVRCRTICPITG